MAGATGDLMETTKDAADHGPVDLSQDAFVALALPVVTHLVRFKWLYAVAAVWVAALLVISPDHFPSPFAQAGVQHAALAPASQDVAAPATAPGTEADLAASPLATSDTFATASSFGSSDVPYGGGDTSSYDNGGNTAPAPQSSPPPPPPPPSCSADNGLPAPVALTAVTTVAAAQDALTGATQQPPPADAAAAAGGAAGCSGGAADQFAAQLVRAGLPL